MKNLSITIQLKKNDTLKSFEWVTVVGVRGSQDSVKLLTQLVYLLYPQTPIH